MKISFLTFLIALISMQGCLFFDSASENIEPNNNGVELNNGVTSNNGITNNGVATNNGLTIFPDNPHDR